MFNACEFTIFERLTRLKQIAKYTAIVLFSMLGILLLSIWLLFNSNYVQNKLLVKVTDYLSAQFKTKISIGHITYHPLTNLTLDQVYFGDQKNDTLFYVEHLKVNIGGFNSDSLQLTLTDVLVDGGLCKIVTYPDSTFNIDVLFNIVSADTTTDTSSVPFKLLFNHVTCINTQFKLIDSTSELGGPGFNGLDEHFYQVALEATDFWIIEDSLNLQLKDLSCKEKGGAEVKKINCHAILASSGMYFNELVLDAAYSHIAGTFSMEYSDWDMGDFNNKVMMKADLKESKVDMRDVAKFAPALYDWDQVAYISGKVKGTVSNLRAKKITLRTGERTFFQGNVNLTGLPEIDETFMDAQVEKVVSNKKDIEYISRQSMPEQLTSFGDIRFSGAYTGFIKDFVAYGQFSTDVGNISSDLNMKILDPLSESSYSGKLELLHLDLGKITGMPDMFGRTSIKTTINGKGFELKDLVTAIDIKIDYLDVYQYRYVNIESSGEIRNELYKGNMVSLDPNAQFTFNGEVDLSKDIPHFAINSDLQYVNLSELGFTDSVNLILSANVDVDFSFKDIDHNEGHLSVSNISMSKNGRDIDLHTVEATASTNGNRRNIHLKTNFADIQVNGVFEFRQLSNDFSNYLHKLAPAYITTRQKTEALQDFNFKVDVKKINVIRELFVPDLFTTNFIAEGQINNSTNNGEIIVSSDYLRYGTISFNHLLLKSYIHKDGKGGVIGSVEQLLNNDTLVLSGLALKGELENNKGSIRVLAQDTQGIATGAIMANLVFSKEKAELIFDSSTITYRGINFNLLNNGVLAYHQQMIDISNLHFEGAKEDITINGFYEEGGIHNIKAEFRRVDLSLINLFDQSQNIIFGGNANGTLILKGKGKSDNLDVYANIDDLILDADTIGDLTLTSNYNEKLKRLMLYSKSLSGKLKDMEAGGYVDMSTQPYGLHINVAFAESDLKSFQAFLKEQVTLYTGTAEAKCVIEGTTKDIEVNGSIKLNHVMARIEYLKTVYQFSSQLQFDRSAILIPAFDMIDVNNRKVQVSGSIHHQSFSLFNYDIHLKDLNKFQVLNTGPKDNSLYYGTAYASGNIHLSGPQSALLMEGNLKTEKGTVFNIPLSSSDEEEGNLINYTNKDSGRVVVEIVKPVKLYGFVMSTIVDITPDAEIHIVFDEDKGDKISGTGEGVLKMEMTKQGLFNMFGEVKINSGEYKFTALDFFTKKFILKKGSTITWSGDPLLARLNITGAYNVRRTSVANILTTVSDKQREEARQQRVPAECLMYITGSLQEPQYKFDLAFTEVQGILSTSTVSALESSLNSLRAEPQLMEQQVINLILFGNFLPLNGTQQFAGNSSLSSGLNNTLSDIASAQANNFLNQVIPGVDLNIDLTRNDQQNIQAIISASKKWLDDRLEIQGSVNTVNNNNNFMTQYNLTKEGNLKLRGYSRSITDPIYNRPINTQGFGLYYRKEFDSFIKKSQKENQQLLIK